MADATSPMSRDKAELVMRQFLDRVREVNSNAKYLYRVARLGVFGSYLSDAQELGDLDVLYELAPKTADRDEHTAKRCAYSDAAKKAGRRFTTFIDYLGWPEQDIIRFLKSRQKISLHDWKEVEFLRRQGAAHSDLLLADGGDAK